MQPRLSTDGEVLRIVAHSARVWTLGGQYGWLPGARYTNLRDVRQVRRLAFLDIDWRAYNFRRHLDAVKATRPRLTVARDITRKRDLEQVLEEAHMLAEWCDHVIVVPKVPTLASAIRNGAIPRQFILGYSVPTRYGSTALPPSAFTRPVHLLGGRPDVQRRLASQMPVVSLDCNRFTLDAAFGDYFDGARFTRHPTGGYERCLRESLANIAALWRDYKVPAATWRWAQQSRCAS